MARKAGFSEEIAMFSASGLLVTIAVVVLTSYIVLQLVLAPAKKSKPQKVQPKKKVKRDRSASYTREEVAKHNSEEDLWFILKNKETGQWGVYDVSEYVEEHPGGLAILRNAGKDSTEGFYGPHHPDRAYVMIDDYYIGSLADP